MLTLLLHAALAGDTASLDTAAAMEDMAPCEGAFLEYLLPPDGAEGVSPDAVPGVVLRADCGASDILAVLTGPTDEVQTAALTVSADGIVRFPELDLTADGTWLLEVQSGVGDATKFWAYDGVEAAFTTGSGAIEPLAAVPTLEVLGTDYDSGAETATVSLHVTASGAPGNAWEVASTSGVALVYGVAADADVVVGAQAQPGDEVCFVVTEYLPDGQVGGTSDPACGTIESKAIEMCGCLTPSDSPTPAAAALLFLAAWGARRARR